jgi:hypothetical protein
MYMGGKKRLSAQIYGSDVFREHVERFPGSEFANDPRIVPRFQRIILSWAACTEGACLTTLQWIRPFLINRLGDGDIKELFTEILLRYPNQLPLDREFLNELADGIGTDRGYAICVGLQEVFSVALWNHMHPGWFASEPNPIIMLLRDSAILNKFLEKSACLETYRPLVSAECFQLVSEVNRGWNQLVISPPVHQLLISLSESRIFNGGGLDATAPFFLPCQSAGDSEVSGLLRKLTLRLFDAVSHDFLNDSIIELLGRSPDAEFVAIVEDLGLVVKIMETFEKSPRRGHIHRLAQLVRKRIPGFGDERWRSFVEDELTPRVQLRRFRYKESSDGWGSDSDDEFGRHRLPRGEDYGDSHDPFIRTFYFESDEDDETFADVDDDEP